VAHWECGIKRIILPSISMPAPHHPSPGNSHIRTLKYSKGIHYYFIIYVYCLNKSFENLIVKI